MSMSILSEMELDEQCLIQAVENINLTEMTLLSEHVDIDVENSDSRISLLLAAMNGHKYT